MTTFRNFHQGEVQLQAESGVDTATFDELVTEPFLPALNPNEIKFVNLRTFSVAASIDADGRPWASGLFGQAGELFSVVDPVTVRVAPQRTEGDPLYENISAIGELGVLYFDPSRRRRSKSLGQATIGEDDAITYRMNRSYGICNKYIFKRNHEPSTEQTPRSSTGRSVTANLLGPDDRSQLEAADTIFLATHHTEHGTDPTHRGGPSGFVSVVDDSTLAIPDYAGNGMFQALGNLLLDDRVGLLSTDFETGRTVQVTGRGAIKPSPADDPYSTRTLVISIDEVRTTWPDVGHWTDVEPFEMRPGLINPGTPFL